MSRVLKFRAKDLQGNWVYGGITSLSHTHDGKTYIVSSTCIEGEEENEKIELIEVVPETVGQFTGREDRNEVEIFEGDIVMHGESTRKVIYHSTNFTLADLEEKNGVLLSFSNPIVIGNMHEK